MIKDEYTVHAEKMSVVPNLYQQSPSTRWLEPGVSSDRIESEWRFFFAKLYDCVLISLKFGRTL